MKRVFKTGFVALALVAGVTGAFATKMANQPNPLEDTYNWTRVIGTPPNPLGETNPLPNATVGQAITNYGCTGETEPCAVGDNTGEGTDATIFLSE